MNTANNGTNNMQNFLKQSI